MDNTLLWMLLVPSLAGLVSLFWPRRTGGITHVITLVVAIWLLIETADLQGYIGAAWSWQWMQIGTVTIAADMLVTKFGAIIALLTAFFGVMISLYSIKFTDRAIGKHNAYVLWTLAGAIGAALAENLVFLLICWEIVTLMLFLLINTGGQKAKAGAAKTFTILGLADCALLLGIGLLCFTGSETTLAMSQLDIAADSPITIAAFLLFATAALAKAGAMPFHTWIPTAAEGAPTDVMAFLPAALDKLLGIYLLARVSLEFFTMTETLQMVLLAVGAVTIVGAVMMAMVQHDLKKLLAFHAVSQVGYMVLGIATGSLIGIAGGIFHMINNAIYKSCLFLGAGAVEKQTGTTELDKLGGLARVMPLSFVACTVAALAISGIPPLNGFASKWMIYQALLELPMKTSPVFVAAAIFGSALTLASFVKVIHSVFLGAPSPNIASQIKKPTESPIWMTAPMLTLAAACVVFGVFAIVPLKELVAPAMASMGVHGLADQLAQEGQIVATNTLWNPVTATWLMLLALLGGVVIFALGCGFKVRRTGTYIGGERMPEEFGHYSGTNFYDTINRLPGIKGVYQDAERQAFDIYHIGGRFGGVIVETLRRCQTGRLSLYVSWVVLGLVIIVIYLAG